MQSHWMQDGREWRPMLVSGGGYGAAVYGLAVRHEWVARWVAVEMRRLHRRAPHLSVGALAVGAERMFCLAHGFAPNSAPAEVV